MARVAAVTVVVARVGVEASSRLAALEAAVVVAMVEVRAVVRVEVAMAAEMAVVATAVVKVVEVRVAAERVVVRVEEVKVVLTAVVATEVATVVVVRDVEVREVVETAVVEMVAEEAAAEARWAVKNSAHYPPRHCLRLATQPGREAAAAAAAACWLALAVRDFGVYTLHSSAKFYNVFPHEKAPTHLPVRSVYVTTIRSR